MPIPRNITLNSAQKQIITLVEQHSIRAGERVLYAKVINNINWEDFMYKEITDAFEVLEKAGLIKKDEHFITRLW